MVLLLVDGLLLLDRSSSKVHLLAVSGGIADSVHKHPTRENLVLAFHSIIGLLLVRAATHQQLGKSYFRFAMPLLLTIERLNSLLRWITPSPRACTIRNLTTRRRPVMTHSFTAQ